MNGIFSFDVESNGPAVRQPVLTPGWERRITDARKVRGRQAAMPFSIT